MSSRRVAVATGGGLKNQAYEMLPVADLAARAAAFNPRKISKHDLDALRRSMCEFGVVEPVVLNTRSGRVVGGHQRVRAAQAEGIEALPVVRVDLDDVREKQLNLALNRISGEWDDALLAKLLDEMRRDGADLAVTGFEDAEIEAVLRGLMSEGRTDPDAVPDPPPKPITRRGDLILLGTKHRLLCGDSTDAADVARLMGEDHAALCMTSPPYQDAREYGGLGDTRISGRVSQFLGCYAGYSDLVAVNLGLLRKGNVVVCYWNEYLDCADSAGLILLSWNVWDRGCAQSIAQHTAMFPIEHEWIFVFGNKRKKLNATIRNKKPGVLTGSSNRQRDGSLLKKHTRKVKLLRAIGTVFRNSPHRGADIGHPAMFPVALPAAYIEATTCAGDVVSDAFCGAGSTIIACEQTGRACRAMELQPTYCDVSVPRWEQFTGQRAQRPARDGKGA